MKGAKKQGKGGRSNHNAIVDMLDKLENLYTSNLKNKMLQSTLITVLLMDV
jgi:hypothetical protein